MTAIRIGIMLLVAFSVLAHGAVEPWSQAILITGAALLLAIWVFVCLKQQQADIQWNSLYWPMLGFGGFVLVQWLWGLSVYPYLTKIEFLKLAACFVLFFLAVQAFRTVEAMRPFVWFLLAFGFAVAFFGILQYFSFNGKIYWLRELRFGGGVFGPYVNHNHFAGLMEMVIPLGLALLFCRATKPDKLLLVALFTLIPIGALFLSASRGGILSFLAQLCLLGFLVQWQQQRRKWIVPLTLLLLLAGSFVIWLGVEHTLNRFSLLWENDLSQDIRTVVSQDTWQIALRHPWTGTGLGTFVTTFPQHASKYYSLLFTHAHNDYVEMAAETGLPGAACSLLFILLLFWSALANARRETRPFSTATRLGALAACSGVLIHSLVDFNFHIPSNAVLFFLLASVATSPESTSYPLRETRPLNPARNLLGARWSRITS